MGEFGVPASKLSKQQVDDLYTRVSEQIIDLRDGSEYTKFDEEEFDLIAVSENPKYSKSFAELRAENADYDGPAYDFGEERRMDIMKVFFVKDPNGDEIRQIVLPIYGKGLWGTLYGYMALQNDLNTIAGITFYQHKETPGLGGEVDNPSWKQQWDGVQLYDDDGQPAAYVYKGAAPDDNVYAVDGLSGATITARGVTNLVQYWASEEGYKPFLRKLKREMANEPLAMN